MGRTVGVPKEIKTAEHRIALTPDGVRELDRYGVIHYAVGNMPGAVPHTATYALSNVTLPYVLKLALNGAPAACRADPALAAGVNTVGGLLTNQPVADFLGVPAAHPLSALST